MRASAGELLLAGPTSPFGPASGTFQAWWGEQMARRFHGTKRTRQRLLVFLVAAVALSLLVVLYLLYRGL
ncbi:MAG: hypothetical protein KGJ23_00220 [Euryarchaeota archaeon]|nr:hypothetical protein [Euryarchaeota archaeon]MDE1835020.1 hypothetical protein [Euryarchaeota archaeon]MDE1881341.1 hypothetical protein [Euryarchaeota archaeon]MDE2044859.1 hypothetical protein [Thermoplasmata archaeon]